MDDRPRKHVDMDRRSMLRGLGWSVGSILLCSCGGPSGTPARVGGSKQPINVPAPVRPVPPASEPVVRVRFSRGTGSSQESVIGMPGQWTWIGPADDEHDRRLVRGRFTVKAGPRGWRITQLHGGVLEVPGARPLSITPMQEQPLHWNGSTWPGSIILHRMSSEGDGTIDYVSHVPMETYLPGVLSRELYDDWHRSTHDSLAVAARSFALFESWFWSDRRHFDLVAGEASQAWVGTTGHRPSLEAVQATRGQLLMYAGRVIPAYYSSCCGDQPSSAIDAIGDNPANDIPPLGSARSGSCPCQWSPTWSWQRTRTHAEVSRDLAEQARRAGLPGRFDLDNLHAISISERNANGRSLSVQVTDRSGRTFTMDASRLRSAFNTSRKRSDQLPSGNCSYRMLDRTVLIQGRGHGHGAGLCQYGAEAQARSGMSMQRILAFYYPQSSIEQAWT